MTSDVRIFNDLLNLSNASEGSKLTLCATANSSLRRRLGWPRHRQPRAASGVLFVIGATALAAAATGSAVAQSVPAVEAPNRTEIFFLGTSGGPPLRRDRSEPAALLIVDGRKYLIDCGIGTMQRMVQAGINSEEIETVFFTHLHADHALGLSDVLGNDFFRLNSARSSQTIAIYGPPRTKELLDAAFHYVTITFEPFAAEPGAIRAGLKNGEFTSPFVAHEIEGDGMVYQDDKIRVTAAENTHYALMSESDRKQMKSYSYRVETPHGVVVFTGDTGPSDALVRLASGADALVTEVQDIEETAAFVKALAARNNWSPERETALMRHMRQEHLDEKQVGEMASRAHVKSVLLDHYSPGSPAAYVAKVKKYFPGPVFAPADLDRYCLDGFPAANTGPAADLGPCPAGSR